MESNTLNLDQPAAKVRMILGKFPAKALQAATTAVTVAKNWMVMDEKIEVGYQVFTADGGEEVGAVRRLLRDHRGLVVYIENTGDCEIPSDAVAAVHSQKVILNWEKLSPELKDAIRHAHDAELPDGEDSKT